MTPSDLTADLPAPRDDEPESLRADIADELADHLSCAVRREQLRGVAGVERSEAPDSAPHPGPLPFKRGEGDASGDTSRAVLQRVLARFGDPAAVARKLWWDAMRERVMRERILTGLTLVAVLVCCAMAGLMWQMQSTQRDMLRESQAQNAKLIEQFQAALAQLKAGAVSEAPSEWNPLTVKCTFDAEDGPPAAGVKIQLQSGSENTKGIPAIDATTSENGVADFGKVLYGSYRLRFTAQNGMERSSTVSVMPGQAKQAAMVCPSGDGLTAITPQVVLNPSDPPPPELADQLWYWVNLVRSPSGGFWTRPGSDELVRWVIGPQGQVLDVTKLIPLPARYFGDIGQDETLPRTERPPGVLNEFYSHDVLLPGDIGEGPLLVEPGNYVVGSVTACLLSPETTEGTRLLCLLPPQRIEDPRTGGSVRFDGAPSAADQAQFDPSFAVVYARPGTVDVPLGETRFDYMRRVLAAAPAYVPLRVRATCNSMRFRPDWERGFNGRALLRFEQASEEFSLLSGIEVIEWEQAVSEWTRQGTLGSRTRRAPPQWQVTAVLLVTPEEREQLQRFADKLDIAPVPEETPRTTLDPDVVRKLEESLEAKPEEDKPAGEATSTGNAK